MKKYKAEKTAFVTIDNTPHPLSKFPENYRDEFEVLDALRQKTLDAAFELEVLNLAVKAKTIQLNAALTDYLAKQAEKENESKNIE